jgi:hypothetical protein
MRYDSDSEGLNKESAHESFSKSMQRVSAASYMLVAGFLVSCFAGAAVWGCIVVPRRQRMVVDLAGEESGPASQQQATTEGLPLITA